MIKYLEIKGFKSIKQANMELKPLNILIGGNGSGKSNFISFFKLLNAIANKELECFVKKEGVDNLLYFGRKRTGNIYCDLTFEDENKNCNYYKFNLVPDNLGGLFVATDGIDFDRGGDTCIGMVRIEDEGAEGYNIIRDNFFQKYLLPLKIFHFHDTTNSSPLRTDCDISDNLYLKSHGQNLPAMLYLLKEKHPIIYDRIVKTVQSVAPYISKFIVEPSALNNKKIELRWVDKGDSESNFSAYQLSDGTLRFIALAVLLMQPNPPAVIIIDEPELGLHPFAIGKLAGMVQSASNNAQIIAATQSPGLISNFLPEDIIVIDKSETENQTIFQRLSSESLENWLEDYTLGDLWERNIINAARPFKK